MPSFTYKVHDQSGKKVKGIAEAISEKALADQLAQQGYFVTSIRQAQQGTFSLNLNKILLWSGRVPTDDVTLFYVQLSNMLEAGLTLLSSLQVISNQIDNQTFKPVIQNIISRIEAGESLSESAAHHQNLFPLLYRSMIKVGEAGGNLSKVLRFVAELEEARSALKDKIRSALAYPVVLIIASIAVIVFMIVWIVPSFITIFSKSGILLPLPTRMMYEFSLWMKVFGIWLAVFFCLVIASFPILMKIQPIRHSWDSFWLKVPVVGLLIKRIEISRWSRSVALMLSSGVNILQTLEIARNLTQNSVFQDAFQKCYDSVQAGGRLADTFQKSSAFPNDVVQMISTGEHSGSLDKMLHKVSDFYDELVGRSLKKLTDSLEPASVLLMGVIVGFIMLSILLPIFDMIKIFSPK